MKYAAVIENNIVVNIIAVNDVEQFAETSGWNLVEYFENNPVMIGSFYDETLKMFIPPKPEQGE